MTRALLDVRPQPAFERAHAPNTAGIPLEELSTRVHELPETSQAIDVFDSDPKRVTAALEFLRKRGHLANAIHLKDEEMSEGGRSSARLWKPNAFLVEAVERVREIDRKMQAPMRALDIACGTGRDAVFLALEGYDVEAIDILPDAIDRLHELARRSSVTVSGRPQDLQRDPKMPAAKYHLICVFRYLQRTLFPEIRRALAPGGFVVYETFHIRNRETGRRPLNPDHLLQDGELREAFAGFDILIDRDAVERDGRYFSSLLARAPR